MSYIPDTDSEFDEFQKNFVTKMVAGASTWAIPGARVTAITTRQIQWNTDYAAGGKEVDRKSSEAVKKTKTRKLYEKEIRDFVQEFITANSLIDDDQRRAMRVTVADTEPTERARIETSPTVRLIAKEGARFIVECRVKSDSTRASKHKDADGVELAYKVAPKNQPPETPDDAPDRKISGKARVRLDLAIADAGKSLFVFARWYNKTDEAKNGPWSTVSNKIISD
jgi:hypothetical protein